MCNRYIVRSSQAESRRFAQATLDVAGNLQPELELFPDYAAPIVRNTPAGRELAMVRWGMPSSKQAIYQAAAKRADKLRAKGKEVDFNELLRLEPDKGTTNVRNVTSAHWKPYLGIENRCVVPFTRFCEPDQVGGSSRPVWFALDETEPLAFFAGIWKAGHTSVRKIKDGMITCDLFAFLTTKANKEVEAYHDKAMPVILRTAEEVDAWLMLPTSEALTMQQPLPNGTLKVMSEALPEPMLFS